ncbi:hypothetical protein A6S26_04745 [Nostoc sp. ATCC 43529]|nr:hypothetical protein A6S26_04745 [Nostoc sp. ATCC 43529]
MSRSSINISHIVLSKEEYRKLKIYAVKHQITIHEAVRLLIDSFPEQSQTSKSLNKNYLGMFPRRFLHICLDAR